MSAEAACGLGSHKIWQFNRLSALQRYLCHPEPLYPVSENEFFRISRALLENASRQEQTVELVATLEMKLDRAASLTKVHFVDGCLANLGEDGIATHKGCKLRYHVEHYAAPPRGCDTEIDTAIGCDIRPATGL